MFFFSVTPATDWGQVWTICVGAPEVPHFDEWFSVLDTTTHFLSLIQTPTEQLLPVLADNQSLLMAPAHLDQSHGFTSVIRSSHVTSDRQLQY